MGFEGKVVFITGGAVGFGRQVARTFTAEGASAVIADIDDRQARETVAELQAAGAQAMAVHCDVSDEQQVEAAVEETSRELGGVDILFNNAALHLSKYNRPFSLVERDEVRRVLDVNVVGVVSCTLACRDSMRSRGGGTVINIASVAADMSTSPYGVSKLAVRGLTVALATELAADGIRVNGIAPGWMATENAMIDMPHQLDAQINERQLIHRMGTMEDVVGAARFLCSDEASFITGETLRVSGGFMARP